MDTGRKTSRVDLLVVGGGVNGAGIARDAAGRGLSVALVERGDLASGTSSASTKLIHGGLRYLEHYAFRLVRESLTEREVLLRAAPHIIWPMRFVLPHDPSMRPAWLIRLGLMLYDHLGPRELLPGSHALDLRDDPAGRPLREGLRRAFEYSDCWVDDARLVVLLARDAANRGASVMTRTACEGVERLEDGWRASLKDLATDQHHSIEARALVDATGPWVGRLTGTGRNTGRVRLVQGSHIVLPRLFDGERAYILQNTDRRIVFAIPYEQDYTLVGTTDHEIADPADAGPTEAEIDYLLAAVGRWFRNAPGREAIVRSFSGVRPLNDEGEAKASEASRDYTLALDGSDGGAPLLTVLGGKITTFRRLSEDAVDRLAPVLGASGPRWTGHVPLPGGDLPGGDPGMLRAMLAQRHPELPQAVLARMVRSYGTIAEDILDRGPLGEEILPGLFEAELDYLQRNEWARTAEDVLWRRTKLGLKAGPEAVARLEARMAAMADAG